MKLIKPSVKQIHQEPGIDGVYKAIADAAKICYKTERTKLSDKEFVDMLINKSHLRPLEFATCYLIQPEWSPITQACINNNYAKVNRISNDYYITTNYRFIHEVLPSAKHVLQAKTMYHKERYTFEFICSRGCGDDYRTHVVLSSIMESSRYCRYSDDKFDNQISFIEPYWRYTNEDLEDFEAIERIYMKKIAQGYQPQQAKNYLPLGYATKLRMCGFEDAWDNFILKRDSNAAYPECQQLANQVKQLLKQ